MANRTLEEKIHQNGNPVDMLRNSQIGPYVFPIPGEYSNWIEEQESWHKSAALFDLSYHMTDVYFEGPDVYRLLSDLAVNSFENFKPYKAKQFVACNYDGYVIGDAINFHYAENKVSLVGRPSVPNWAAFHAETGDYNVKVTRDDRSVDNPGDRLIYRYQIQGPNALKILEKVNSGPLPDVKFFNMCEFRVGEEKVLALNHGMSRTSGLEVTGPFEERHKVKSILLEAGEAFGLRQVGGRAYSTVSIESGWIPSPTPAIYSGEKMRSYREWLSGDGFEANASLGGSYYSGNIEDYYQTPWDLGYGSHVKFDHDFIGRDALESMANRPHRRKVWLIWNEEDVLDVFSSQLHRGERYKHLEMPGSQYATCPFDKVICDDKLVGLSTYAVYTANARSWISLAMIDEGWSEDGKSVIIVWGESNGGTKKPTVERHKQKEIRAKISVNRPEPVQP